VKALLRHAPEALLRHHIASQPTYTYTYTYLGVQHAQAHAAEAQHGVALCSAVQCSGGGHGTRGGRA